MKVYSFCRTITSKNFWRKKICNACIRSVSKCIWGSQLICRLIVGILIAWENLVGKYALLLLAEVSLFKSFQLKIIGLILYFMNMVVLLIRLVMVQKLCTHEELTAVAKKSKSTVCTWSFTICICHREFVLHEFTYIFYRPLYHNVDSLYPLG